MRLEYMNKKEEYRQGKKKERLDLVAMEQGRWGPRRQGRRGMGAREGSRSKKGTPEHGKRSRSGGGRLGQGHGDHGQRRRTSGKEEGGG